MGFNRAVSSFGACCATLAIVAGAASSSAANARFTANDPARIVGLSSPQISPDGTHAVVVVSRIDMSGDTYRRDIDLTICAAMRAAR